jgi:hypothetical protein
VNPLLSGHEPKVADQECATEGAEMEGRKREEIRNCLSCHAGGVPAPARTHRGTSPAACLPPGRYPRRR